MEFKELFKSKKPVIGMIHLAENSVDIALDELLTYERCGLDGAIVENYHGDYDCVVKTLEKVSKRNFNLAMGVNILPNEFKKSFELAKRFNAGFIQLDYVSGKYLGAEFGLESYNSCRKKFPEIAVFGGVWPKYYTPAPNSSLEDDLRQAMNRADAIVVTGQGTGIETPVEKIKSFRKILGDFPLIVGAGLNIRNVFEQLCIADGAIVGSAFKEYNDTFRPLKTEKITLFMEQVKRAREYK